MDYLAQTAFSNNLMKQGADQAASKSRIFPTVSAPSLENDQDEFAKSNITGVSELVTKRTALDSNPKNLFHRMDDVESLTYTPQKGIEDDATSESGTWMKSLLARADRTTDSNLMNQLSDRDNTRLSSNNTSNPLS